MAKPKKKSCNSSCCSESYTRPKPEFVKTDRVCHPMSTEDGKMPRTEYDEIFRKIYDQHALSMDYDLVTIQENYSNQCTSDSDCTENAKYAKYGFTCKPALSGTNICSKSCTVHTNGQSDCPPGYFCGPENLCYAGG